MSQKFIEKEVKIEGYKWVEIQKSALDYLAPRSTQIKQEDILFYSFRHFVNDEIGKSFREFGQESTRIYFSPLILKEEKNLDRASAVLRFYYVDELEKYNWNQKLDIPFNDNIENDPIISQFIEKFLKEYDFRLETNGPVTDNMFVRVFRLNKDSKKEFLNFETADKRFSFLTQKLIGLRVGDIKEIEQEGEVFNIEIEKLWEYKKMPITDENAKYLKMEEIHDVKSAKEYITSTVTEQMFLKEVTEYKMNVVAELMSKLPKIELAEEFIEYETKIHEEAFLEDLNKNIKNADVLKEALNNQREEFKKMARINAVRDIELTFYDSLIAKGLKILITDDEIIKEEKSIYSFIPPNQRADQKINIPAIIGVLTARKIGLYFLEKNHPEIYRKYVK